MTATEQLRHALDRQLRQLASLPIGRDTALLALVRELASLPCPHPAELAPDLLRSRDEPGLGSNRALQLCFEAATSGTGARQTSIDVRPDDWAKWFLAECGALAEADQVLAHCESGFMQVIERNDRQFEAWIATKQPPARWRERVDFAWWGHRLVVQHLPELHASDSARRTNQHGDGDEAARYRNEAAVRVKMMAHQLSYPAFAELGGCTIQTYRDLLTLLISRVIAAQDRGELVVVRAAHELVAEVAAALAIEPDIAERAISAFTLDGANAAYHAAVPGIAAAPLVQLDSGRIALSHFGLTTQPLLFLTRELRRRDAAEYHNAAYLREDVFRHELYALFRDKRFVTSSGRIVLRRDAGTARTDIDAAVFDRKTGTLGLFELKSHDPFARSTAELLRQRDNVLYANRQISGMLAWVQRHGANEVLGRVDAKTAKMFRVQKLYPFVLGRYLAHFTDGQTPDRRAAWGTWPQVLGLLDERPWRSNEANPLASLFTRLQNGAPPAVRSVWEFSRTIEVGDLHLTVHPSYAAFKGSLGESV